MLRRWDEPSDHFSPEALVNLPLLKTSKALTLKASACFPDFEPSSMTLPAADAIDRCGKQFASETFDIIWQGLSSVIVCTIEPHPSLNTGFSHCSAPSSLASAKPCSGTRAAATIAGSLGWLIAIVDSVWYSGRCSGKGSGWGWVVVEGLGRGENFSSPSSVIVTPSETPSSLIRRMLSPLPSKLDSLFGEALL